MKNKKYLISVLLVMIFATKTFGHGGEMMFWSTFNSYGLYDGKNGKILPSIDINQVGLAILNVGINYKYLYYYDPNKITLYFGLGIMDRIQFQWGSSKYGSSIRIRSDIPLGTFWQKYKRKDQWENFVNISFTAEKYYSNPQMKWFFGIGIGYSLRTF